MSFLSVNHRTDFHGLTFMVKRRPCQGVHALQGFIDVCQRLSRQVPHSLAWPHLTVWLGRQRILSVEEQVTRSRTKSSTVTVVLNPRVSHVVHAKQQKFAADSSGTGSVDMPVPSCFLCSSILEAMNRAPGPPSWRNRRGSCSVEVETNFAAICRRIPGAANPAGADRKAWDF